MLGLWLHRPWPTYIFGVLAILGVAFMGMPKALTPLYLKWLKIAHLIGRILTTVMLSVAYYVVITPSALIKRLISGSPLPLRPDKQATSYWVTRTEPAQPRERFLKRY